MPKDAKTRVKVRQVKKASSQLHQLVDSLLPYSVLSSRILINPTIIPDIIEMAKKGRLLALERKSEYLEVWNTGGRADLQWDPASTKPQCPPGSLSIIA